MTGNAGYKSTNAGNGGYKSTNSKSKTPEPIPDTKTNKQPEKNLQFPTDTKDDDEDDLETGSGDKDDEDDKDEDYDGSSVPTEEKDDTTGLISNKNPIHKTEITTNGGSNGNGDDDGDDGDDIDDGNDGLTTTISKDEYGRFGKTDEDIPSKLKHFYFDFKSMRDSKQIRQKNYANHLQQKQFHFDFDFDCDFNLFDIQFIRFIFPQLIFLYIIVRIR